MQSRQEEYFYEYSIIRYVPSVERQEFVNVGLIMMCKRLKWARMAFELPEALINHFGTAILSASDLRVQLTNMQRIAHGDTAGGEIASYSAEERYRWLAAVRSTCIQASPSHPGITEDLEETFDKIYSEMVAR